MAGVSWGMADESCAIEVCLSFEDSGEVHEDDGAVQEEWRGGKIQVSQSFL